MLDRASILDYLNEYKSFMPQLIERELQVPLNSNLIISLIGPRRAGKTYYFFQLEKKLKKPLYLNFEDSRLRNIAYNEIRDIIRLYMEEYGEAPKELLLDEVQNIDGWDIIVRELHDLKKYKIFVTGSSSKMLSKEIATKLRGRTLSYILLPFSFREFLKAKGIGAEHLTKDKEALIKNALSEYLEYGGFPDVVIGNEKEKILAEYADLILFRDFIERHEVRNIQLARYIQQSIMQNFSKEITSNSLFEKARSSGIKVSNNTIYDYLEKLNDTVIFFFVDRYSEKAHERAMWPKKVYLADTGLSKAFRFGNDMGKLMENVVFLELLRRKNSKPLLEVYYLSNSSGEVDFVLKEGNEVTSLIQVTYELNDDNKERELKPLLSAYSRFKCKELTVLTWEQEEVMNEGKTSIKITPLWKWLLGI